MRLIKEGKDMTGLITIIDERLRSNYTSDDDDLEVQDRAQNYLQLINHASDWNEIEDGSNSLFASHPMNPVASKAQKKVPIPPGLDLEQPFVIFDEEVMDQMITDEEAKSLGFGGKENGGTEKKKKTKKLKMKSKKERMEREESDPNYLKTSSKKKKEEDEGKKGERKVEKKKKKSKQKEERVEFAEDAVTSLVPAAGPALIDIPGLSSSDKYLPSKVESKKKNRKGKKEEETELKEEEVEEEHKVTIRGLEMPEGVNLDENDDDDDEEENGRSDPHKALSKVVLDPLYTSNPRQVISERVTNERLNETQSEKHNEKKEKSKKKKKNKDDSGGKEKKEKRKKKSSVSNGSKIHPDPNDLSLNIPTRSEYEETFGRTPDQEGGETADVEATGDTSKPMDENESISGTGDGGTGDGGTGDGGTSNEIQTAGETTLNQEVTSS